MSWTCPKCKTENEDYLNRCVCGRERLSSVEGFGGYLIGFAIGLICQPLALMFVLVGFSLPSVSDHWSGALEVAALLLTVVTLIFSLYLLMVFFQKRKTARTFLVAYFCCFIVSAILNAVANGHVHVVRNLNDLIGSSFLQAIVGSWYFLTSDRVKATFVK